MGVASEDVVLIQFGKRAGEPAVITVNCPDKTGLGCDLCRTILEFGLRITRGDVSTDGKWCYIVLWVVPRSASTNIQWASLKSRLVSLCPSATSISSLYFSLSSQPAECPLYLLKIFCRDRKGLLHDVTYVLCELELLIHRVKVSTTPDGRVVDFFFITDGMLLMHKRERQEETHTRLNAVLGESFDCCEIQLVGKEYETSQHGLSSLPPAVVEELLSPDITNTGSCVQTPSPDLTKMKQAGIKIDNSLSPAHTLLQIHCADQKGLLYDIMRTFKDCNIQIAYGRFLSDMKGSREVDLFLQQNDGKKIMDSQKQDAICARLRMEMLHPMRVIIVNRGPDTELLVANPVELCGKGRPRVFYDVTLALKVLEICIFSAEIGRHSTSERQWEVYRFRLDETPEFPLANIGARNHITDTVRKTLMGW